MRRVTVAAVTAALATGVVTAGTVAAPTTAADDGEICTLARFSTLMGASVQISRDQSASSASRVFSACSTRSA
jgi:hypothetical protein